MERMRRRGKTDKEEEKGERVSVIVAFRYAANSGLFGRVLKGNKVARLVYICLTFIVVTIALMLVTWSS